MQTYTGKNVDDAVGIAARDKGVTPEEITYTVLEESSGFLGIGSKATISAYCKNDIRLFIISYLDTYFKNIGMEASVEAFEDNDFYRVNLDAENNAILIGKNGKTLQALNAVLKTAVSSEFKKRIRVLIDINGYKEEKYQKVCSLASRVAKTVQRSKTDAILDPMPADERKAIHNHLKDVKHISTVSEGEGNQRRLKIVYNPDKD